MANSCGRCNILAKHKYWEKNFTGHRFFKIMLGDFEHQLRIPRKFVENLNGEIPKKCMLIGPSGNRWRVKTRVVPNDVVLSTGWNKFVRDHGVEAGDFLVFSYANSRNYSHFNVSIFDKTGCEVEASQFSPNLRGANNSCASSLHLGSTEASNSSRFPSLKRPRLGTWGRSSRQTHLEISESCRFPSLSPLSYEDAYPSQCYLGLHGQFSMHEEFDIMDDDDEEEDEQYSPSEMNDDHDEEEEVYFLHGGSDHNRVVDHLRPGTSQEQRQVCYVSNRRAVTKEEKERAQELAVDHMIKNDHVNGGYMIQITMLPSHVYTGFHLTIPKNWALEHMLKKSHDVELRVPGVKGRWLVGCRWTPTMRQCQLIPRWPKFVLDNNLEEHDVCVFELVRSRKPDTLRTPLFNVHIFRVVENPVRLTVKRRYN